MGVTGELHCLCLNHDNFYDFYNSMIFLSHCPVTTPDAEPQFIVVCVCLWKIYLIENRCRKAIWPFEPAHQRLYFFLRYVNVAVKQKTFWQYAWAVGNTWNEVEMLYIVKMMFHIVSLIMFVILSLIQWIRLRVGTKLLLIILSVKVHHAFAPSSMFPLLFTAVFHHPLNLKQTETEWLPQSVLDELEKVYSNKAH